MRQSILVIAMIGAMASGGPVCADTSDSAMQEYTQALKLTPNLENGKKIYHICTVCHTPEGWGLESGAYPQVAGQLRTVIIKQLGSTLKLCRQMTAGRGDRDAEGMHR